MNNGKPRQTLRGCSVVERVSQRAAMMMDDDGQRCRNIRDV